MKKLNGSLHLTPDELYLVNVIIKTYLNGEK